MPWFSNNQNFNTLDKTQVLALVVTLKIFRSTIRKRYLEKKYFDPNVLNEQHEFFFRNGKRIAEKGAGVLRENGYPTVSLEYECCMEKLRSDYSISRFGDGEYSILKSRTGKKVYFDRATEEGKSHLMRVLNSTNQKHLIGLIHPDVVARQLTFANAMSLFKKRNTIWADPRMPIFSEYDEDMLGIYNTLCAQPERVVEAGLFRNRGHTQHARLWKSKDILYVTGSVDTSLTYGVTIESMFSDANSIEIIETVTENALSDHYDHILKMVLSHPDVKEKMILISQGMAGTVLAFDLAENGCHAIDLGQPFVYYQSRKK